MLELYKIMIDSAQKVTEWRQRANEFFLAVNSALIAIATYLTSVDQIPTVTGIVVFGIVLAWIWYESISSYSKLAGAKWRVISEIEQKEYKYPIFKMERQYYKEDKRRGNTSVEKMVPAIFIVMYLVILLFWFKII